jgi:hypothetical protein
MPTAADAPINSTFLILLNVLGSITSDARENRIAAYREGSIVGAAEKISLITAKLVDHIRHIPNTTPFHSTEGCFLSLSTDTLDSNLDSIFKTSIFADFIPVVVMEVPMGAPKGKKDLSRGVRSVGRGTGTNAFENEQTASNKSSRDIRLVILE